MVKRVRMVVKTIAVFGLAASFISCQEFFTSSLAAPLARDAADLVPTVTAGNAAELADKVSDDPDASLVVLEGLDAVIANASPSDTPELVSIALDLATNASGIGSSLWTSSDITDAVQSGSIDTAVIFPALDTILAGLDNLDSAASALIDSLSYTTIAEVAAVSSPDALAMAAIVLLANDAATYPGGVSTYVDDLGNGIVIASLATELAQAASDQYILDNGSGLLADLLSSLNLAS